MPIRRVVLLVGALLLTSVLGSGVAAASTATAAVPAAAAAAAVPCRVGVRACVRLSTNQAWLLRDGLVVMGPVPVSHGRAGFRTPPGTFRVSYLDKDHISSVFDDAPMPYSVFFNGDIAFHQGSVRVRSHGCIHLSSGAARVFFGELRPGDVVQVVR